MLLQQLQRASSTLHSQAWESGLTCAAFATVVFSLSALQVKLTGGRVPVLELCVIRSSISFCTSITVGTASRIQPLFGHRRHLPLLFLRGLFGTCAIACSYVALLNLPLGDAVTLAQLRPPMMAVMGWLLLGEGLGWGGAAGCLISLAGAVIVSHPPFLFGGHSSWGRHRLLGTLCGIASPLFGAGTGYCIRRIKKQEPALVVALWFHTVTVGLLLWPLLAGWPQAPVMVAARDAVLLLGISCSSFCAQLMMTRAYQLLPAARASALSFLGVVYSHILGALVFGEEITPFTIGGGLLIFAGVLVVALRTRAAAAAASSSNSSSKGVEGGSSSRGGGAAVVDAGAMLPEDVEAAQPLKQRPQLQQQQQQQLDEQQQQQQQQQQRPDTFSVGVDQAAPGGSSNNTEQYSSSSTAAAAVADRQPQAPPPTFSLTSLLTSSSTPAAPAAAAGSDVELGVRLLSSPNSTSSSSSQQHWGLAQPSPTTPRGVVQSTSDAVGAPDALQPLLQGVSSNSSIR